MNNAYSQKRIFNDIYGFGYPFNLIHPYKQKSVKFLVDNCPTYVDMIIVFGSAVKSGHFWWNDLDVCLIGKCLPDNYSRGMKMKPITHRYDFVTYNSLEELEMDSKSYANVGYHIKTEGVIVYESK